MKNLKKGIALGGLDTVGSVSRTFEDDSKPTVPLMVMKENRTHLTTEDTLRAVKESMYDSMYESSKTFVKQLNKTGDKLTNVVEDFQKKQSLTVEVETEINPVVEAETIQEKITGTEAEIEETVETTVEIEVEVEIGLTQEMEEEINKDSDQVKDTLTRMTSVTSATKRVIQHIGVTD